MTWFLPSRRSENRRLHRLGAGADRDAMAGGGVADAFHRSPEMITGETTAIHLQ